MKKIFSIIALAAGMAGMSSCSDFLDQNSPSEMTGTAVYNNTYYTGLRVNKLYGALAQDRTYSQDIPIKWGTNSDCELVDGLGQNAYNQTHYRGVGNYNVNSGFSALNGSWTALYGIIEDANLNIEGIRNSPLMRSEGENKRAMRRYLGESLTLRAMVYFDMLRYWGDIPLNLTPAKHDLSNAYKPKTDRDIIMDTLMLNLEEAIELLPWAGDVSGYTTERMNKGYAHALLAQIALTRAGYAIREKAKDGYETADYTDAVYPTQRPGAAERKALYEKALKHLTAVITEGRHQLNPSFENEWYLLNQLQLDRTYKENLFEIPMGENATGELGYTVGVRMNQPTTLYGYGNSSGVLKVTAPLLYSYDENDTRRDVTASCMEIRQNSTTNLTEEQMLKNAPFGMYVGKWDPRKMSQKWLENNKAATGKHATGINVVKIRYSQVLLYYAEVMNELAGPDGNYTGDAGITARQALAMVHTRAFNNEHKADAQQYIDNIPANKDALFNAIVDENAWEFAGEGYRKFDLIRWNLLVAKIQESKETYMRQLQDGTYQETVYFNYKDEAKTQIDMSSVTWYGLPADKTSADYAGSADSFGKADPTSGNDTQVDTNLPSISSGLVGTDVTVKNRYLMPIGASTISASNGMLSNSYGYSN